MSKKKKVKYQITYVKTSKIIEWLRAHAFLRTRRIIGIINRGKWYKKILNISVKLWVLMNEKRYKASGKITIDKINSLVYLAKNKAPAPINELKITFLELQRTYKNLKVEKRTER